MAAPAQVPADQYDLPPEALPGPPGASVNVGVAAPESDKDLLIDRPTNPYLYTTPTGIPVYGAGAPVLYRAPAAAPQQAPAPDDANYDLPPEAEPQQPRQPGFFQQLLNEGIVNPSQQFASGFTGANAGAQHIIANTAMMLDHSQQTLADLTGMDRGTFFKHVEDWAKQQQQYGEQKEQQLSGGRQDLASKVFRGAGAIAGGLPFMAAATAAAGSTLGMGLLGGLETADQGFKAATQAALENMTMGKAMEVMGPAARPIRLAGTALATFINGKIHGLDNETAWTNALATGALSAVPPGELSTGQTLKTMASIPALAPANRNLAEREAMQYMAGEGVHVPAPAAAGSSFWRGVQKVAGATPLGSLIEESARHKTVEGVRNLSERLVGGATPETPPGELYDQFHSAENAPSSTRQVPTGAKDEQGRSVTEGMQMPVNVGQLKSQLRPTYDQMQWMPMADRNTSAGYTAIKRILDGPDYIPASQAETGLSGIKSMIRTGDGRSQGLAGFIAPKLQELIDGTVQQIGGDEAMAALQRGRVAAAKQAGADWLSDVFAKAKAEGSFNRQDALWNQWLNLRPEAKRTMFSPRQVADLNRFFLGTKALFKNVNPSGTAPVLITAALMSQILSHPFTAGGGVLLGGGMAKLLNSKFGVKLLTEGLGVPENTLRGREIGRMIRNIVEEQPSGGAASHQGPRSD